MIVNTIQNFQRHAFCVCVWREGIWRCMGGWVICECPTEIMFTTSWLIIPPSMTHALTFDSFVLGLGWVGQHKLDESRAVVGIPLPHNWSEGGQRELLSLFFMECLGRNAKMKHYVFLSTPWHTYLYEACKREASLRVTSSYALVSSRWPSKERDGGQEENPPRLGKRWHYQAETNYNWEITCYLHPIQSFIHNDKWK